MPVAADFGADPAGAWAPGEAGVVGPGAAGDPGDDEEAVPVGLPAGEAAAPAVAATTAAAVAPVIPVPVVPVAPDGEGLATLLFDAGAGVTVAGNSTEGLLAVAVDPGVVAPAACAVVPFASGAAGVVTVAGKSVLGAGDFGAGGVTATAGGGATFFSSNKARCCVIGSGGGAAFGARDLNRSTSVSGAPSPSRSAIFARSRFAGRRSSSLSSSSSSSLSGAAFAAVSLLSGFLSFDSLEESFGASFWPEDGLASSFLAAVSLAGLAVVVLAEVEVEVAGFVDVEGAGVGEVIFAGAVVILGVAAGCIGAAGFVTTGAGLEITGAGARTVGIFKVAVDGVFTF